MSKVDTTQEYKSQSDMRGKRTNISISHIPASCDPGRTLIVNFPILSKEDVIVAGSARLTFDVNTTGTDTKPQFINNLSRNLVSKIKIGLGGNTVSEVTSADVFYSYLDHWKPELEKRKDSFDFGIYGVVNGYSKNCMLHRIGSEDKVDNAADEKLAKVYGKRYAIPLDFEMFNKVFNQSTLSHKISCDLTFNRVDKVIKASTPTLTVGYNITNIELEFETVNDYELSSRLKMDYVKFDKIICESIKPVKSNESIWNWNFTHPSASLKGILLIAKTDNDSDKYWDMNIKNVEVSSDGKTNQLFNRGLRSNQIYNEAFRFLGGFYKKSQHIDYVTKELGLASIWTLDFYAGNKSSLFIDFRSEQDNSLFESGSQTSNVSLKINREVSGTTEALVYCYLIMDAELSISNGYFDSG